MDVPTSRQLLRLLGIGLNGRLVVVGVHVDLAELRAEGVARHRLLGLDLVARVEERLAAALRAQLPACTDDRCAPRGRAHGPAGQRREWQRAVADVHPHPLERHVEGVGRDLREDRARAGADVRRGDPDDVAPVVLLAHERRARAPAGRVRGAGDAGADVGAPLEAGAGSVVARLPSEEARALAQARDEVARAERHPRLGIGLRLVADP